MGEKHNANVEAKTNQFALTIKFLSGETICAIDVEPSWSIARVKNVTQSFLNPLQVMKALLHEDRELKDDATLSGSGLEAAAVLQAVLIGLPKLHLFNPCSAQALSKKRGKLCVGQWGSSNYIVAEGVEHCGMDSAPALAREIANDMAKAAPNLGDTYVTGGDSDEGGTIIVISNAGSDPKSACFKSLAFVATDPHTDRDLWACTDLEEKNWKDHLEHGLNVDEEDDEESDDGLLAINKIMAERLTGHFEFGFTEKLVVAPVIYGGYTADGSIVGVLSGRVWT